MTQSGKVAESAASDDKQIGIDLAHRFLANPQNQQLRNDLAVYCQKRITAIVRYLVVARGYHPPGESKDAFVEDACQDVLVKVLEKIGSLATPDNLFAWLREVSFNLLVTEYRDTVGRGSMPRMPIGTEIKVEDGSPTNIFEVAEGRDAAIQHLARSLTESADAECWTEKIHDRALLEKALAIHANSGKKRDFESSLWIKETWDYPDVTAEQIAKLRHRSVGDTQHILRDDNDAIIPLARYLIDPDAAEREWAALIKDIEAVSAEDSVGPEAQALANRWERLGGDLEGSWELRTQYLERTNRPVPLMLTVEKRTFICRAVEASRKSKKKNQLCVTASRLAQEGYIEG